MVYLLHAGRIFKMNHTESLKSESLDLCTPMFNKSHVPEYLLNGTAHLIQFSCRFFQRPVDHCRNGIAPITTLKENL